MSKSASKPNSGQIRMIGGQWRGRKLAVANVPGLRPTTDRVRETLFNWLQFELRGARVLDLFAGTGALGFEALSRGASHADLVEPNAQAAAQLRQHAKTLQANADIHTAKAEQWLQRPPVQPYDVVFIDPPFGQQLVSQVLPQLASQAWLRPNAWVYIETERGAAVPAPSHWRLHRELTAGQAHARLFKLEDN